VFGHYTEVEIPADLRGAVVRAVPDVGGYGGAERDRAPKAK